MINPTSKKTGIATINPVNINAHEAFFLPKVFNNCFDNAYAPPEASNISPKIAPNPTIVATDPKVLPIPF